MNKLLFSQTLIFAGLGLLFLITSPSSLWANQAAEGKIVINEIAWMGTEASGNNEWIEIYNPQTTALDLTGWQLQSQDQRPQIDLSGTIPAKGYFLLERTDDQSLPQIEADLIYTGALANSGEYLELRDENNDLVDWLDCSNGWFAGNNQTKQTMERKDPLLPGSQADNWQDSQEPGGTPKAANSSLEPSPAEESTTTPAKPEGWQPPTVVNHPPQAEAGPHLTGLVNQEISFDASRSTDPDNDRLEFFWSFGDGASQSGQKVKHGYRFPGQYIVGLTVTDGELFAFDNLIANIYTPSIIISEFLPQASQPQGQWIELYNQSGQPANLSDWQISHQATTSHFIFPANTLIGPKQFLVIPQAVSQISLTKKDELRLSFPNGSLASRISYDQSEEDSSIAFDGFDYFWTAWPTPGSANIISSQKQSNQLDNNPAVQKQAYQPGPEILATLTPLFSHSANVFSSDQNQSRVPPAAEYSLKENGQLAALKTPDSFSNKPADWLDRKPNQDRARLILILSIIISAGLLVSWLLILLKRHLLAG